MQSPCKAVKLGNNKIGGERRVSYRCYRALLGFKQSSWAIILSNIAKYRFNVKPNGKRHLESIHSRTVPNEGHAAKKAFLKKYAHRDCLTASSKTFFVMKIVLKVFLNDSVMFACCWQSTSLQEAIIMKIRFCLNIFIHLYLTLLAWLISYNES